MDEKQVHDLSAGMRLLGKYAQRLARERGHQDIEVDWTYRGLLRDGPMQFILTLRCEGRSQVATFSREAIEGYPGAVGVVRTEAMVKECLRRLDVPASRNGK